MCNEWILGHFLWPPATAHDTLKEKLTSRNERAGGKGEEVNIHAST